MMRIKSSIMITYYSVMVGIPITLISIISYFKKA